MNPLPPESIARFRDDLAALRASPGAIGLAVSGGPDSLALLLLAAAALPGKVRAATVDHGLRPASAQEATFVAGICAGIGVPHATLAVAVDTARASLQQSAREARYRALDGWLGDNGLDLLATGHHADDQAETLIMRLLRGAGVGGLSAIRAAAPLPVPGSRAAVLRPLLGWRRAELEAIVTGAGLAPVRDPSNSDERYDRARVRRRLAEAAWLDPAALARSAAALGEADQALAWTADRLWAERIETDGPALLFRVDGLPAELKRRLVARLLARCRPDAAPPRGQELGRLLASLEQGATATLAGVKCGGGEIWRFSPERPRRGERPG